MNNRYDPRVTIGIPTYNRADDYLKQTLTSALNQTYQNIEIIVADNCSTDNTEKYVNSINESRIRYFKHHKNIRANDNFNFCLEQAKGQYFLLLHDDDLIDEDFVDVCLNSANDHKDVGVIRTGMRRINYKGQLIKENQNLAGGLSTEDFFLSWLCGETPMHLCCSLFNTKKLVEIGGFRSEHELFQDVIAEVKLAAIFGRVDVKDIKASFRMHPSQNTSAVKIKGWCKDSLELLDIMCGLVQEKKSLVKRQGMQFFINHNYNIASRIKSPLNRLIAFFTIYKMFDYQYFPIRRLLRRNIQRPIRLITGEK
jgi:glycosyltransferase involved in cell wall biosynthesis